MLRIYDKTAISNYCSSCLAGTCSGEYCAGVPGWIICWILLSDSRNLCLHRSFEHWVWNQYGLDNELAIITTVVFVLLPHIGMGIVAVIEVVKCGLQDFIFG